MDIFEWDQSLWVFVNSIKAHPQNIKRIDIDFFIKDPKKLFDLVEVNYNVIRYIDKKFIEKYPDFYKEVLKMNPKALQCIPLDYRKSNIELCVEATSADLDNIRFFPLERRREYEKLCIDAVHYNFENISYIPFEIQEKNVPLCIEAVKNNPILVLDISEKIISDNPKILENAVRQDPTIVEEFPDDLIEHYPNIYNILILELKIYQANLPEFITDENLRVENKILKMRKTVNCSWKAGLELLKEYSFNEVQQNPEIIFIAMKNDIDEYNKLISVQRNIKLPILREYLDIFKEDVGIDIIRYLIFELIVISPNSININFYEEKYSKIVLEAIIEKNLDFFDSVDILAGGRKDSLLRVFKKEPEFYLKILKNKPEYIFNIPLDIQREFIGDVSEAFNRIDFQKNKYIVGFGKLLHEVQESNIEKCKELLQITTDFKGMAVSVLDDFINNNYNIVEQVLENSNGVAIQSIPSEIQIKYPQILKKSILLNPTNFRLISQKVKKANIDIIVDILKEDKRIYFDSSFKRFKIY